MASYTELFGILSFTEAGAQDLLNKITSAVIVAADIVSSGGDTTDPPWDQTAGAHDLRIRWANNAFMDPIGIAKEVFPSVLAANESATVANIIGASDAAIQSNVNAVVDLFAAQIPDASV